MSNVKCQMSNVDCQMSYVKYHVISMSNVKCQMSCNVMARQMSNAYMIFVIFAPQTRFLGSFLLHTKVGKMQQNGCRVKIA